MRQLRHGWGVGEGAHRRGQTAVCAAVAEGVQGRLGRRDAEMGRAEEREAEAYLVLRDGKRLGKTTRTTFTDTKVKPGATYRYSVRALDARNRAGALSSSVRVKVPRKPAGPPAPSANPSPAIATVAPTSPATTPDDQPATPTPPPAVVLSEAMVDRLFWRAGFGSTQAQRDAWTGRTPAELVDWFLNTPSALDESLPKPLDTDGGPIDTNGTDVASCSSSRTSAATRPRRSGRSPTP
jgi:hypothetical protein